MQKEDLMNANFLTKIKFGYRLQNRITRDLVIIGQGDDEERKKNLAYETMSKLVDTYLDNTDQARIDELRIMGQNLMAEFPFVGSVRLLHGEGALRLFITNPPELGTKLIDKQELRIFVENMFSDISAKFNNLKLFSYRYKSIFNIYVEVKLS